MNRITPEMVKEAAEKTGLKLKVGDVRVVDGYTDALGVVARANGVPLDASTNDVFAWAWEVFPGSYWEGFIDGCEKEPPEDDLSSYMDGYSDGLSCAAAVFGKGVRA